MFLLFFSSFLGIYLFIIPVLLLRVSAGGCQSVCMATALFADGSPDVNDSLPGSSVPSFMCLCSLRYQVVHIGECHAQFFVKYFCKFGWFMCF